MPLTATTGTPRTRARPSNSETAGTARIGPSETMGFEGAMTMTSASPIAARTSAVGRAASRPAWRTSCTSGAWRRCTKYSWKSSQPSSVRSWVRTGSSAIGRIVLGMPSARCSSMTASVSGRPPRINEVRAMCVAKSRSPRRNQASSPYRSSIAIVVQVSSTTPQPRSSSNSPASMYMTESWSGMTSRPWRSRSSPVLTMTVSSPGSSASCRPCASFAPPVPPARVTTFTLAAVPGRLASAGWSPGHTDRASGR